MSDETPTSSTASELGDDELLRYSRQILLPEIDIAGQLALANSRVMIVGLGGLGSPAALYLASSGIGHLTLCDPDLVELSNLHRQIAHDTASIGTTKVGSAQARATEINPSIKITSLHGEFEPGMIAGHDVVLDCTDNATTRYAINDACFAAGTPLVSGAAIRWEGQLAVFDPRIENAACYRCLYPDPSSDALDCATNGVAPPGVGSIGVLQALETIKLLTEAGETLTNRVMYADFLRMEFRTFALSPGVGCTHGAGDGVSS